MFFIAETFGSEHRPIVQFALDDIRKLRLRKSRLGVGKEKRDTLTDVKAKNPPDVHKPRLRKTRLETQENQGTQIHDKLENASNILKETRKPRKMKRSGADISEPELIDVPKAKRTNNEIRENPQSQHFDANRKASRSKKKVPSLEFLCFNCLSKSLDAFFFF